MTSAVSQTSERRDTFVVRDTCDSEEEEEEFNKFIEF
jgi:hypothetical protein